MAEKEIETLYVPILPDTKQLTAELDKIGYEIRVKVRDSVILGVQDAWVSLRDSVPAVAEQKLGDGLVSGVAEELGLNADV